jgi:quercetin dioxygenase-like cupin family protein
MVRTSFIGVLVLVLVAFHVVPTGNLWAQVPGTPRHDHLTEVACVDVPPGEKRPEFGCFNVGTVTGLHFSNPSVYWQLRAFPSRKAADAAKSASGIVVEEDGRAWLSEFGAQNNAPRGGESVAVVGPLQLPAAQSYAAVLSYAVMRPGDSSRVHTHPGPEAWYVLAGEQCLGRRAAPPGLASEEP